MDVLVTYDINTETREGERRLARVAAICESYGTRMQYSVFECRLSATRLQLLITELESAIQPYIDSVNIYRFPGTIQSARTTLGNRKVPDPGTPWIL